MLPMCLAHTLLGEPVSDITTAKFGASTPR